MVVTTASLSAPVRCLCHVRCAANRAAACYAAYARCYAKKAGATRQVPASVLRADNGRQEASRSVSPTGTPVEQPPMPAPPTIPESTRRAAI